MLQENLNAAMLKALQDSSFREKLIKDPRKTLASEGYNVDTEVQILEETKKKVYFVLPYQISEEVLENYRVETDKTKKTFVEIMNDIIVRCFKDKNFKERFKKDPKGIIEMESKITFPADFSIEVLENTNKVTYLALPSNNGEFSEQELMQLAGGVDQVVPLPAAPSVNITQPLGLLNIASQLYLNSWRPRLLG